jgi:hypothetical protein
VQLELARCIAQSLAKAPDRASILNDPRRIWSHIDLLERLREAGVNRARVVRASELPAALRFPVFLRQDFGRRRILSPLLRDAAELSRALGAARRRGHALGELLVTEFCDTADARGLYRHHSALRVGDEILPHDLSWSRDWRGEQPCAPCEALGRERQEFLEAPPHEGLLRTVCEAAGIDFGRIDYSLLDGKIQVWGICTNPTVRELTAG